MSNSVFHIGELTINRKTEVPFIIDTDLLSPWHCGWYFAKRNREYVKQERPDLYLRWKKGERLYGTYFLPKEDTNGK